MKRGQIAISTILSVASLIGAIATPVLYIERSKTALAETVTDVKRDVAILQTEQEYNEERLNRIEDKLDAVLTKLGVNPKTVE